MQEVEFLVALCQGVSPYLHIVLEVELEAAVIMEVVQVILLLLLHIIPVAEAEALLIWEL